jgi:hypothetical protein
MTSAGRLACAATQARVFTFRFGARFFVFFDDVFFGAAFFRRAPFDGVFFVPAFLEGSFDGVTSRSVSAGGVSFEPALVKVRSALATKASAFANRSFS